jgi:tRNA(Arg) A34 adenosine deaminase TadA
MAKARNATRESLEDEVQSVLKWLKSHSTNASLNGRNRTCAAILRNTRERRIYSNQVIPASYKPRKKFMELALAEARRAGDRGDYPIGAVITRLTGKREVVIASAGNRVKTSGSSIKHVELETLKYVSSGYGRYLPDFVLYSTHEPCAMCAGACVWSRIGAVVYGVSQEDIAAYGRKRGTEDYKWRACLISCRLVFEKGNHFIPVIGGFLRKECQKLFSYRTA